MVLATLLLNFFDMRKRSFPRDRTPGCSLTPCYLRYRFRSTMRMSLRLVATLLAISFVGSLSVQGEECERTTTPCSATQAHSMDCCQPTHSCCDLSGPAQSLPNSLPARATTITGHEIVKVVSLPVDAMFFAGGEYLNVRSTARADTSLYSTAGSYLFTHAFLI